MNHLYFGDCLDVLKQLKDENPKPFIDLIYIDPPFNSKRNYNVLFESMDMKDAIIYHIYKLSHIRQTTATAFGVDNSTFKKAQKNEGKSVSKGLFD